MNYEELTFWDRHGIDEANDLSEEIQNEIYIRQGTGQDFKPVRTGSFNRCCNKRLIHIMYQLKLW